MDMMEGYQGFGGKSTFNGDISRWNTEKVTTMYGYVYIELLRSTKTLGSWNTAQVTIWAMFLSASAFNQDIGSWNTEKVTTMEVCFITLLRSTKTLGVGTQRK